VAAINLTGGSYEVGGTFHSTITGGDGGITIGTAALHADIVKIGAFGDNGSLTVGGGLISGDTTLKLYAPGSNGHIDFISNVTLNSNSSVIIAANAVTINNGIVVTITGDKGVDASVFTNVPNYTGSGGNGSTTGTFAGNGAQTAPLDQAPPFDDPFATPAKRSTTATATQAPIPTTNPTSSGDRGTGAAAVLPRWTRYAPVVRVADSNELLDLEDRIASGSPDAGYRSSNTQTGRNARGPGSLLSGKGRALPPNVIPVDRTLGRFEGRTSLRLP
jgi:hypothetical protein